MGFNLKKTAKNEAKHYDQMLVEKTEPHNFTPDKPGTTDWLLQQEEHRAKDTNVPWEKQLEAVQVGEDHPGTLEAKMDKNKQVYNLRRTDKAYSSKLLTVQQVAEAHDQKHYNVVRKLESAQDTDTLFWDKYVGVQISDGMKTTVPVNKHKSQLQNHPDRFKNLDNTMPINEKMQEDEKTLKKEDKIYEMVTASLKDADAMLFQLYANASIDDRELNGEETKQLNDINSSKARLLAFLDGKSKQQLALAGDHGVNVWERSLSKNDDGSYKCNDKELEYFDTMALAQKSYPDSVLVGEV